MMILRVSTLLHWFLETLWPAVKAEWGNCPLRPLLRARDTLPNGIIRASWTLYQPHALVWNYLRPSSYRGCFSKLYSPRATSRYPSFGWYPQHTGLPHVDFDLFISTPPGRILPSLCGLIPNVIASPPLPHSPITSAQCGTTFSMFKQMAASLHTFETPAPHIMQEDAEPNEDLTGNDFTYSHDTTTAFQELLSKIDSNTKELPNVLEWQEFCQTYCACSFFRGTFSSQKKCLFLAPWKISGMINI